MYDWNSPTKPSEVDHELWTVVKTPDSLRIVKQYFPSKSHMCFLLHAPNTQCCQRTSYCIQSHIQLVKRSYSNLQVFLQRQDQVQVVSPTSVSTLMQGPSAIQGDCREMSSDPSPIWLLIHLHQAASITFHCTSDTLSYLLHLWTGM